MTTNMPPAAASSTRTAWLVVALLMPVALLNYLDRQMMASMKTSVMESIPELAQSEDPEKLWGWMLGQFKWVYAGFSVFGGYIADRFSRRFTICASLFVWSGVTFWTGHVTTFDELLWARSAMGISEAFYIPAALALIADYHTGETRSRAVGMHQMGIYLGVILGGFGGYFAADPNLGWRLAFTGAGVIGMLYALPLVLLLRDVPRQPSAQRDDRVSPVVAVGELLSNVSFILLVLCFTLPAMAGWIVRDWMPAILQKQFDIGQGLAGVSATLYWQVAAIVGAVAGGWLADDWMRRSERGRTFVSALGISMIVAAIFGVGNANSLLVAIGFLILFGIGWGFFDCNNMPILSQIVRPELRATGYGIMNLVSISCGGLADVGFGILKDRDVPLNITFTAFAAPAMLSIVLMLLIRPRREVTSNPPNYEAGH